MGENSAEREDFGETVERLVESIERERIVRTN